jgi:hypothetical protein
MDASIVLSTDDYLRIAQPQLADIRQR